MLLPRVLTAIVLIALVAAALFGLNGLPFKLVALVLPVLGAWEWAGLFACTSRQRTVYSGAMLLLGLVVTFLPIPTWLWDSVMILASIFWLLVAPLWLFFHWKVNNKVLALFLGALLLFAAWQGIIRWHIDGVDAADSGGWILLRLMAVVWIADSAAYFAGRAFGRHKLAPQISPGKTWEGAAGALLAVTVYIGWLIIGKGQAPESMSFISYLLLFLVGLLLTTVSIVGDLLESLFKRQAGVKDSGRLLPGHGGMLDRVDSLIAVLAVAGAVQPFVLSA